MDDLKICPRCKLPYDWPGVTDMGKEFCCAECARGEPCACPQHDHRNDETASGVSAGGRLPE
jgi:hypothetical protein